MFYFGVDYYPEHWPEKRWPLDAALMAEAGFNVVRMAEFAWSKIEPREEEVDFSWLDRAIDGLSRRGLQVVLGTPTAGPPAWLMIKDPEMFRVREDGQRLGYGNRREYCPNHPVYREYTTRIVERMAVHYTGHPAVIGWQVDNEFGDRCYCPVCHQAFQSWLRQRYSTLDALNERWGTVFWSHTYSDWNQIPLPLKSSGSPNPGLGLDFCRFASESYVTYQSHQVKILRSICPGQFITHNMMGFDFDQINYYDLARDLDFVALTHYPRDQWKFCSAPNPARSALQHDCARGLKGLNFWMMEQQVGQSGWENLSLTPRPGEARLWAYQAIAHGANAILFFRWRTARFGTEQYWQGMLDYGARPTRRFEEIKRMGAEIQRIGERLTGTKVAARVAFLLSYDSRFAFQIQPNNPQFKYAAHFQQIYEAFHQYHIAIDIVHPEADLSPYALIVAPSLFVLTSETAENLERFVAAGGNLFLTQRSGVKDVWNAVVEHPLPGQLSQLCGGQVEEIDSLPEDLNNEIELCLPEIEAVRFQVGVLCEILKPITADVVGTYTKDFYAGKAAILYNRFGQGKVVYAGAIGSESMYVLLARWLLGISGVTPVLDAPKGVEVTERTRDGRRLIFVLNHNAQPAAIRLEQEYRDLLSDTSYCGTLIIPPAGVAILVEERN